MQRISRLRDADKKGFVLVCACASYFVDSLIGTHASSKSGEDLFMNLCKAAWGFWERFERKCEELDGYWQDATGPLGFGSWGLGDLCSAGWFTEL